MDLEKLLSGGQSDEFETGTDGMASELEKTASDLEQLLTGESGSTDDTGGKTASGEDVDVEALLVRVMAKVAFEAIGPVEEELAEQIKTAGINLKFWKKAPPPKPNLLQRIKGFLSAHPWGTLFGGLGAGAILGAVPVYAYYAGTVIPAMQEASAAAVRRAYILGSYSAGWGGYGG